MENRLHSSYQAYRASNPFSNLDCISGGGANRLPKKAAEIVS